MLLYGHPFIPSPSFYHIQSIESILHTPPSSTILVEFHKKNLDIMKHLQSNSINFAIEVHTVTDTIYASALGASFIIVPTEIASTTQNIANTYLFDAKILVLIESEDEIQEIAMLGIDGVILSDAIIKINS